MNPREGVAVWTVTAGFLVQSGLDGRTSSGTESEDRAGAPERRLWDAGAVSPDSTYQKRMEGRAEALRLETRKKGRCVNLYLPSRFFSFLSWVLVCHQVVPKLLDSGDPLASPSGPVHLALCLLFFKKYFQILRVILLFSPKSSRFIVLHCHFKVISLYSYVTPWLYLKHLNKLCAPFKDHQFPSELCIMLSEA